MDQLGPFSPAGPMCGGRGRREIDLRRGFNSLLPFLRRYIESDLFELDQEADNGIVQFQLTIVAVFVRSDGGN